MVTLELILEYENMYRAYDNVVTNKGAAGIEGVKCKELKDWFFAHKYEVTTSIRNGSFKPSPIKRVYIPKDNG